MHKKTVVFIAIIASVPLVQSGVDIYTPSLPAMSQYFHSDRDHIQLTITYYILALGIGQIFWGSLSDVYGRRNPLIIGIALFFLGAVLAMFAPSLSWLYVARVIQGFGIAAASAITKAMLSDAFSGKELINRSSHMATAWAAAPILAPVLGGYIQHYTDWHMNFAMLACYAFILLILLTRSLPETNTHCHPLALKNLTMNYVDIIKHKIFIGSILVFMMVYSIFMGFNITAPFVFQQLYGYSPVDYGHIALLVGAGVMASTYANRHITDYIEPAKVILLGMVGAGVTGLIMMLLIYWQYHPIISLVIPTWFVFFFAGLAGPNCMAFVVALFPKKAGAASAALGLLGYLGTSVTTALISQGHLDSAMPLARYFVIFASIGAIASLSLQRHVVE